MDAGTRLRIRRGETTTFSRRVRELGSVPEHVESQLKAIEALCGEIKARQADGEIGGGRCRVQTPDDSAGVGPVTSLRFVSALDEAGRFPTAHRVESYLGLVPGESSSSESRQKLPITKAGQSGARWTLVQAAWSLRIACRSADARPMQLWAAEVEKRRGRRIATVALATKADRDPLCAVEGRDDLRPGPRCALSTADDGRRLLSRGKDRDTDCEPRARNADCGSRRTQPMRPRARIFD